MNIVIEKALMCHKPAIMNLLKQANMHYIPSPEMPELNYDNYFVAKVEGRVVGFSGYKILSSTEAKTELMVVDKKYRGRGIGYALQVRRMEDMLARGIRTLTTNTDLPATIEWYKRHFGYVEVGRLEKLHEFGSPAINHWTVLRLNLKEWARKYHKDI
jgi:N-acetylglutamate synthase-like GNAT family acetyltransferase